VVDAVRCAVEVQREMITRNAAVPAERRIEFRMGINLGDIIIEDGDIFGDGVNIAARLEALAAPGGICLSAAAHEQVRDRLDIAFEDLGEQQVKNITRPVRTYAVALVASSHGALPVGAPLPLPDKLHQSNLFWGSVGAVVTRTWASPKQTRWIVVSIGSMASAIALWVLYFLLVPKIPDIAMRLVYPTRPALMLDNQSSYTARTVKYACALIYLNGKEAGTSVPIVIATADFINGHDSIGPENLFDPPQILKSPSDGQKMFGWIQISCPDCIRTRFYWAYIKFGFAGWYSEVSKTRFEEIDTWLNKSGKHDGSDSDINEILSVIPMADRIQIQAP
jgi:hypothetical protein